MAVKVPVAPKQSAELTQQLERFNGSQKTVPKPFVTNDDTVDSATVNLDFEIPDRVEFEDACPAPLALAHRCARDEVSVASSLVFAGANGLYPARDFKAGDVVARVEPLSHKWLSANDSKLEKNYDPEFRYVELAVQSTFRTRKMMVCVGDPSRQPWANINLVTNDSPAAPNLTPKVMSGNMGDDFLVLVAKHDIPAFSGELLWQGIPAAANQDASAPAEVKVDPAPGTPQSEPKLELKNDANYEDSQLRLVDETSVRMKDGLLDSESPAAGDLQQQLIVDCGNVEEHGEQVSTLTRPEGVVYFVKPNRFFVAFSRPQYKLSGRILYSVVGGATRDNVQEKIVRYTITEKTTVMYNKEKKTLKDVIQSFSTPPSPSVYGRTLTKDNKVIPKVAGGSPIDLWWCPPPRYLPLVKALLDTLSCQTMFLMEDNGDGMLHPVGVNFSIPNITFGGKGAHARFWPLSQR